MYLTQTEINRLWAGGEKDGFQHIFVIDFTNFDARKLETVFQEFKNPQNQTHPGKGGLAATYTSLAALFYTGRCLIQISLSTQ